MKQLKIIILSLITTAICPTILAMAQAEKAEHVYNRGIDFYNKSDYNKATEDFLKALNTENRKMEQWASFNLGNAHFQNAEKMQDKQPGDALNGYKSALKFFQRAIELDPLDKDAKYNYELTSKKIQQQEQNQQQQQEKQKNQQEQGQDSQQEQQKQQEQNNQQKQQDSQQQSQENQQQQSQRQNEKQEQESRDSAAEQKQSKPREMTKEEAQMLLENFKRSEDGPTELRLLDQQERKEQVTEKDW